MWHQILPLSCCDLNCLLQRCIYSTRIWKILTRSIWTFSTRTNRTRWGAIWMNSTWNSSYRDKGAKWPVPAYSFAWVIPWTEFFSSRKEIGENPRRDAHRDLFVTWKSQHDNHATSENLWKLWKHMKPIKKSSMKKMRRETPRWSENTKLLPMEKRGSEHVAWLFSVFLWIPRLRLDSQISTLPNRCDGRLRPPAHLSYQWQKIDHLLETAGPAANSLQSGRGASEPKKRKRKKELSGNRRLLEKM